MAYQNKIKTIPLTSFDSASLTGSYQAINSSGFEESIFLMRLINDATTDITISYDGITDHDHLAGTAASIPRETLQIDLTQKPAASGYVFFPKGTVVYIKGIAGVGTIYLSAYYQSGS
jgi:hypothetical protein